MTAEATAARWRALRDYAELASASRSVEALTQSVVAASLTAMNATSASLSRLEPESGRLTVLDRSGALFACECGWVDDRRCDLSPSGPDVGDDARGHLHGSLKARRSEPPDRDELEQVDTPRGACFPVLVADQSWGTLCASRFGGEPFDEDDCAGGLVLVGLLSAGLSRIELLTDLSTLAFTDSLTGLANRRAVDDWLEERLSTPGPFSPVSMVLCDINGLKRVNDELGHTAGDELLRLAAAELTEVASTMDNVLVARLGGDEFVILMHGSDSAKASAIENHLATVKLPHGSGLSVGASTSPSRPANGQTVKSAARALFRLADAAQYRHKRARSDAPLALAQTSLAVSASPSSEQGAREIADDVLSAFRQSTNQTPEWRLQTVCDAFAHVYEAGSWWVSRHRDGFLVDVMARLLRPDARGALAGLEFTSGQHFDPTDYPASAKALSGGSYFATLTEGDLAERAFIARMGYICSLAAGECAADGTGWLVEICGDSQTSQQISASEPTLRALVHIAVAGATV